MRVFVWEGKVAARHMTWRTRIWLDVVAVVVSRRMDGRAHPSGDICRAPAARKGSKGKKGNRSEGMHRLRWRVRGRRGRGTSCVPRWSRDGNARRDRPRGEDARGCNQDHGAQRVCRKHTRRAHCSKLARPGEARRCRRRPLSGQRSAQCIDDLDKSQCTWLKPQRDT